MRHVLGMIFFFGAAPAVAQEWNLRAGDQPLDMAALQRTLVGQEIVFFDNGRSAFAADGRYSYTYHEGGTAWGQYQLEQDGTVCIAFDNGWSRCDLFVRDQRGLVLITEDGDRFPVRP